MIYCLIDATRKCYVGQLITKTEPEMQIQKFRSIMKQDLNR